MIWVHKKTSVSMEPPFCCPCLVFTGCFLPLLCSLQSTRWPIPQCYYWIFRKLGGSIHHISLCHPSPLLHSFFHSSFFLFNNSLSALWPLIKMNSLCCHLLLSSFSLSQLSSFRSALYWPSSLNVSPLISHTSYAHVHCLLSTRSCLEFTPVFPACPL